MTRATKLQTNLDISLLPEKVAQDVVAYPELTKSILRISRRVWLVTGKNGPAAFVGVVRLSLVGGTTRIWLLPCTGLSLSDVRALRRALRRLRRVLGPLSCTIEVLNKKNVRFAEWLGFEGTGKRLIEFGKVFEVFEVP